MKSNKRLNLKRIIKSDRKINQKNKNLMMDKILSYNPRLLKGIEVYKDANRNFTLLIFLGALLINFPLISVPCCILSMFFIIRMLQFIRYKSINNIVKVLAKDLTLKGIYDKEKVEDMLCDFRNKYGENIIEYRDLIKMINKYETLVVKIECVLKNINVRENVDSYKKNVILNNGEISCIQEEDKIVCDGVNEELKRNVKFGSCYKNFQDNVSVLYRKEDGKVKKINKAIEFFDNENNQSFDNNTVVLKNVSKDNKNITVYLYKKSPDLQKNAL